MTVRFVLNGKPVEAHNAAAHTSLLSFLREQGLTGTKEGCAEGECGACAVALVTPGVESPVFQAVNSCLLPLGACHGRTLVSVEGVAEPDGTLHPVQEAMVAEGGSQCGYCTPGFVMSMFCEYYRPGRDGLDPEAISGNLCRCTGYRPILAALSSLPRADDDASKRRLLVLPETQPEQHGPFLRPRSLSELWQALRRAPGARIIAGGTDLMVEANQRFTRFTSLVSLESVPELGGFEKTADCLQLGAALNLEALAALPHGIPLLDQLLPTFASRLIRHRATLGGNLVTASPIGDAAPVLLALDATLILRDAQGTRSVALADFFTAYRETVLRRGEIVAHVHVPLPVPHFQRFYKVSKRNLDDISTVSAAFTLDLAEDGRVARLRLAFGGVAASPLRAHAVEQLAQGKPWSRQTVDELCGALASFGTPLSDLRGSAEYRRAMLTSLLEKFWTESQEIVP